MILLRPGQIVEQRGIVYHSTVQLDPFLRKRRTQPVGKRCHSFAVGDQIFVRPGGFQKGKTDFVA